MEGYDWFQLVAERALKEKMAEMKDLENKLCRSCRICGDRASGRHYGVPSCDGCRGFFKRSVRRNVGYLCKFKKSCVIDVERRNQCQFCRYQRCLKVGMNKHAVQQERSMIPWNKTALNTLKSSINEISYCPPPTPIIVANSSVLPVYQVTVQQQPVMHPPPLPLRMPVSKRSADYSIESLLKHTPNHRAMFPMTPPFAARPCTLTPPLSPHQHNMEFHEGMRQSLLDVLENSVRRIKKIPTLWNLGGEEKVILIEENCMPILLLGLHESLFSIDSLLAYLNSGANEQQNVQANDIIKVEIVLKELRLHEVDDAEVAYLKALSLIRTPFHNASVNELLHRCMQETKVLLSQHVTHFYAHRVGRLEKLLSLSEYIDKIPLSLVCVFLPKLKDVKGLVRRMHNLSEEHR